MANEITPSTLKPFSPGRLLLTLSATIYLAYYVGEPFLHGRTPLYRGYHLDHWLEAANSAAPEQSAAAFQVLTEIYPARSNGMCCSVFCIFSRTFVREMRLVDNARAEMKTKIDQITASLIRAARVDDEGTRTAAIEALALVHYDSSDKPATQLLPVLLPAANDTNEPLRSVVQTCVVRILAQMAINRDPPPPAMDQILPVLLVARTDAKLKHPAELALAYYAPESEI